MHEIVKHDVKMDTVAEWFFVRSPVRNIEGDGLLSHYSLGARVRISSVSFFFFSFAGHGMLVAPDRLFLPPFAEHQKQKILTRPHNAHLPPRPPEDRSRTAVLAL